MDTRETNGASEQDKPSNVGERVRREAKAAADSGTHIQRGSRPSAGTASLPPVQATPELITELTNWRDLIKTIRADLKQPDEWKRLSEVSQRDYTAKFAMLGDRLPADVAQCKKSYYVLRAAFLHGQSRAIRSELNTLDKWVKENGGTTALTTSEGIRAFLDHAHGLSIVQRHQRIQAVNAVKTFDGASRGLSQPSHGKRKLGALPWNWKTKLLGGVPKTSQYRAHVAAMAMCGCRPSEFADGGVSVTKVDEDTYQFHIAGKKTGMRTPSKGSAYSTGQTLRTVTVTRTDTVDKFGRINPEFIVLERAMKGKTYLELSAKATAIRDVVIHASEKMFPDLKNKPTAYSFRHAFASNLKAQNGVDSVDTAAALGHASTKTQGCYGYGRSGGGGLACTATASDRIRTPHLSRKVALKNAAVKKNAVKVTLTDSIDRVLAKAKPPAVSQQVAQVVAKVQKVAPPKPAPSFAKPMRFR
jgi:integrase